MLMRRFFLILFIVQLVAVAGGCSDLSDELLARAETQIDAGSYRAAIIDLKTILQKQPNNMRARWLLGSAYTDIEDGESAEKELRRAASLGVTEDSFLPLLTKALLLQKKYDEILSLEPEGRLSSASIAEVKALQGLAYVGKGEFERAQTSIDAAKRLAGGEFVPVQFAEATLLAQLQRLRDAEELLNRILAADPEHGHAWSLLGNIQFLEERYAEAELSYTAAMRHRAVPAFDQLRRGFARLSQEDITGATEDAEFLAEQYKGLPRVQYFAGLVYMRQGKTDLATEALERSISLDPGHYQSLYLMALAQRKSGSRATALDLAERVVAQAPNFVAGRKFLATLYLNEDQNERAEETIGPVVEAVPDDVEVKEILAASLIKQGKTREAARLFAEIAGQHADDPSAQLRAGISLLSMGREREGVSAINQAARLAPERRDVNLTKIGALLQGAETTSALELARRYRDSHPEDVFGHIMLGMALLANEQAEAAKTAFRSAVDLSPGHSVASRQLAALEVANGDLPGALGYLRAAASRNPRDALLLHQLAKLELVSGNTGEAAALLTRATKSNPNYVAAKVMLARLRLTQNDPGQAIKVLASAPASDRSVLVTRADAYMLMGQHANAREVLESLRVKVPDSPDVHFALARVYAELGDHGRLKVSLDRVLEIAPGHPQTTLIKARVLALDGNFDEANRLLEGLNLPDRDASLLRTRLFVARARGDIRSELKIAQSLAENQPSTASVLALSAAHIRSGDAKRAEDVLERWLQDHSDDAVAMRVLSQSYLQAGKVESGLDLLHKLIEIDPDDAVALNNLAWFQRLGNPEKALEYAERAYALAPKSPNVLDTYAELLARNAMPGLAVEMIERAVVASSGEPHMKLRRAEINALLGKEQTAVYQVQELMHPDMPESVRRGAEDLIQQLDD